MESCKLSRNVTSTWPLCCSIEKQKGNYLRIDEPVYDTDDEIIVPQSEEYYMREVQQAFIFDYFYSKQQYDDNGNKMDLGTNILQIPLRRIDEKREISKAGNFYYYNFTITLHCNNDDTVDTHTFVPIIDTNNHGPFFGKPKYTYNLISSYAEDFKRQQLLNPIIATDYDVTNTAVKFNIEENNHFDIMYNGIVPNSLNKQHYALLTPKIPGKPITDKIEVIVTVTDMGFPSRSNVTKVEINPPSPPMPIFKSPFYVGHYYKNHTFVMHDNLELEEGCTFYSTTVEILVEDMRCQIFYATIVKDEIIINKSSKEYVNNFYEENYTVYKLKAKYTNPITNLFTVGTATFILEHHHDL
ncbi:hypothetical protein TcasGA2_TC014748 [Tribolium castaneum]|uniref:Cadherin domain-containing protein n=1 Tax=Tribolium castaneum TaxID=7070 RepID=A0A139WI33_TRICA|nr:PREDICTED: uncharacterized protein LOC664207 isoform X2 [Tribolium castaneum]KYB27437.1 hypothetical protein TcasGA2_TC014748 [Tribolium castaneum]|eukprot:XP_015836101.1 PREDICTED: uncharacterized protein LOC664207 isoform X2 [Tribolium castaneum]